MQRNDYKTAVTMLGMLQGTKQVVWNRLGYPVEVDLSSRVRTAVSMTTIGIRMMLNSSTCLTEVTKPLLLRVRVQPVKLVKLSAMFLLLKSLVWAIWAKSELIVARTGSMKARVNSIRNGVSRT